MKLLPRKKGLKGTIKVPGDKSISHRSIMFGAAAAGRTTVKGFLAGEDCLSTIRCFRELGVAIEQSGDYVEIEGKGIEGLIEPSRVLDVGNSGTTIRLMLGLLANTPFHSVIAGDDSIAKRPMDRVVHPLKRMGAAIEGREHGSYTPISLRGGGLKGIDYTTPVASAQVKSAILLAGLKAEGMTSVTEPYPTRDHTERMLKAFGAEVRTDGLTKTIRGGQCLTAADIRVPGDISSAAFFLAAGALLPGSELTVLETGINPTRTGLLDVLRDMGASLTISNERGEEAEPYADITVQASDLKAVEIGGELIPRLIDEIPVIALMATQAKGVTVIKDAAELKVKETNRIDAVAEELSKMGASIEATEDGLRITGGTPLHGARVDSRGDHRIGMMLAIAACAAEGETILDRSEAVNISYPNFFEQLKSL